MQHSSPHVDMHVLAPMTSWPRCRLTTRVDTVILDVFYVLLEPKQTVRAQTKSDMSEKKRLRLEEPTQETAVARLSGFLLDGELARAAYVMSSHQLRQSSDSPSQMN